MVDELKSGGRGSSGTQGQHRLHSVLVAAEVALAVVLVAGAGLLLKSFSQLYRTDPGFDPDGVLAVQISSPNAETEEEWAARVAFFEEVQERLGAFPGVSEVGAIHLLPLTADNWSFPYLAEGHDPGPDGNLTSANIRIVTPGYFATLEIPVLAGRPFDDTDRAEGPGVGLVNRAMADELWPGEDPLGKEILLFGNEPFTVVGVVGDVRQFALDRDPLPEMYRPVTQFPTGELYLMLKAADGIDLAAKRDQLEERIWAIDPTVPIPVVEKLSSVLADSVARPRFFAAVLAGFGLLALALGVVGVYGVTAFNVARRVPEYGVRMALGAPPSAVVQEAVAGGIRPVAIGVLVGLFGALLAGRLLSSLLYRVSPGDLTTLVSVAAILSLAAAAAVLVPARRASRVDPVEVLKAD